MNSDGSQAHKKVKCKNTDRHGQYIPIYQSASLEDSHPSLSIDLSIYLYIYNISTISVCILNDDSITQFNDVDSEREQIVESVIRVEREREREQNQKKLLVEWKKKTNEMKKG